MKPIISIENVGKKYIVGTKEPYVSLRDSLSQTFKRKEHNPKEEFWALQDVSFDVQAGESIGIIGRNGAGKSTLLKVLSQITPPTTGKVTMRGRVASLLEVGTGFHPELTGRENIYLNGAILGMSRAEIKSKFDEIVDFAGVEKFLDTPVKRYSSGMSVRLAFAVAAHLEPEILIVDEVLAVGDAEFQKKCLSKMEQVTKQDGRTILFVSHNLITVQNLCKRSVLLENGKVKKVGETHAIIDTYLNERTARRPDSATSLHLLEKHNPGDIHFSGVQITTDKGSDFISSNDKLHVLLKYDSNFKEPITDARIVVTIFSESSQNVVMRLDSDVAEHSVGEKLKTEGEILCETGVNNFMEGKYFADIDFLIQGTSVDFVKRALEFEVSTDMRDYGYKINPDRTIADHVVKYSFKQKA